jgi:hypothetical protein
MTAIENRRSFRVSETVYLSYDALTDDEFAEGLERRKIRLGMDHGAQSQLVDVDARLSQSLYMLHAEYDQVGKLLTMLNDKLNIVISQMPGLKEAKSLLASSPPQICDVSADGIVFYTTKALPVGSKYYLEFLLESDNRYIETFCTVVRHTDPGESPNPGLPCGNAVEFNGVKSGQREILIQHMFNVESETLRMRRLEMNAADE